MPEPIDVTFELVTPAYAGGADPARTDGLRPPTLKALLRFWWRTSVAQLTPARRWDMEAQLFGSTSYRRPNDAPHCERGGQSLRIRPTREVGHGLQFSNWTPSRVQEYLGYGRVGEMQPIRAQTSSTMKLIPRRGATEQYRREIYKALWLLSAFGGIGGRSRRGWGSLRVLCDFPDGLRDPHENPQKNLKHGLSTIFPDPSRLPKELPEYTAFSQKSLVVLGPEVASWEAALNAVGNEFAKYRRLRGAGQRGGPKGPDNRWRRSWFDWLMSEANGGAGAADGRPDQTLLDGAAFGLPQNAYFRYEQATLLVGVGNDLGGRRASPLFISVLGNRKSFRPVILYLPALFLPSHDDTDHEEDGDMAAYVAIEREINKKKVRGTPHGLHPLNSYQAVTDFFRGNTDLDWKGLLETPGWQEVAW